MKKDLWICGNSTTVPGADKEQMSMDQLSALARSGKVFGRLFAYRSVTLHCDCLETLGQPFLVATACRLLASRSCRFQDDEGKQVSITLSALVRMFGVFVKEQITAASYLKEIENKLDSFGEEQTGKSIKNGGALFLRCDLPYYYIAGGSIGHIAGVVNNLEKCTGCTPVMLSAREIPTVSPSVKYYGIAHQMRYRNVGDVMSIAFNDNIRKALSEVFEREKIAFIYQRSALNAYAGMECAVRQQMPFVLEYNGSEIWIAKNWGNRNIRGESISEKIEMLTFEKADLITCVSTPLKQQLIDMGVEESKIIVTPNGVNPDMYRPDIDGTAVREQYGIAQDKTVIGFIGTFGAWHGAEVLAAAYAALKKERNDIHLMMIGDGIKMTEVKKIVADNYLEDAVTLTGIVPQKEGPQYLAACDILVSPTLKNPDGTPFFGSPTKLFEYMAMGKGIVTSDIDQMAEVLENGKTALLVEPNDIDAFKGAIEKLVEDRELRLLLGRNAREEVCTKYTWEIHTKKIVSALKRRMNAEQA